MKASFGTLGATGEDSEENPANREPARGKAWRAGWEYEQRGAQLSVGAQRSWRERNRTSPTDSEQLVTADTLYMLVCSHSRGFVSILDVFHSFHVSDISGTSAENSVRVT